eukprot:m.164069 g.164069  ORF g.164069 m.164069 type:complete len:403 (+) comp12374_c0_seq1:89-1297(+)
MGAQLTWFNKGYLTVRLVLWTLVAVASLIDWLVHRNEKPRGWQLHRVISLVLLVYVVQEAATTAFVTSDSSDAMYSFLIFIYNLADSLFLGVLLIISCGWQITRDSFKGRHFIFWFPPIHFACSVTVDYILDKHIGHENSTEEVAYIPDSSERTILIFAYFGSIITLFYGWWWIFTCLAIERTELNKKINGRADDEAECAADGNDGDEYVGSGRSGSPSARLTSIDLDSDGEGEEVVFDADTADDQGMTPRQRRAARARARAGQLGETLISDGADGDGGSWSPSADHSSMPDRAKLRMLSQYGVMVQCYLFTVLIVLLVNAWRQDRPVASIVLLEMLHVCFLASLLYTFRLRNTNPYYMLDEHDYHDDSYGAPVDSVPNGGIQIAMRTNSFEIGDEDEDEEV